MFFPAATTQVLPEIVFELFAQETQRHGIDTRVHVTQDEAKRFEDRPESVKRPRIQVMPNHIDVIR